MDSLNALFAQISPEQLNSYYDTVVEMLIAWTPRLVGAFLVLVIGWWVIGRIGRVMEAIVERTDADEALEQFVSSLIKTLLKILLLVAVADMIGIATTSFVAILGAAGLAVGLALQGSLSNFAGGVLILLFRPFRLGDFIEAQGVMGTVKRIQIFSTVLNTPDNKRIIIPNGALSNDNITNFSAEDTRRIDLTFGIGYDDDLRKAKALLAEIVAADARIHQDPEPFIAVAELADSSVNFVVRLWVQRSDYWPVHFAMLETVKLRFDAEGISIPYPQQDVHLHGLPGESA